MVAIQIAVSNSCFKNKSDDLLNDTPTSSPSLLAEMVMSWLCHFSDLLALVCYVYCIFVTFPCGILGQVWYLTVLFLDLCVLP